MGSSFGKGVKHYISFKEEGKTLQIGVSCAKKMKKPCHILLHCVKTRVLWEFLFSIFKVVWDFPASTRQRFGGMEGVLCGEEKEGGAESSTFMPFLDNLESKK